MWFTSTASGEPAVESQATDRAVRIGQKNNVLVRRFFCKGTVDERINVLASKQQVSDEILSGGAESTLTEMSNVNCSPSSVSTYAAAVDA